MTGDTSHDKEVPPQTGRPATALDVYRRATDGMRDATKWLMAFVPGAGLGLAIAGIVPALADIDPASDSRGRALGLLIAGAVAAAIAVLMAARVLTSGPTGWGEAIRRASDERSHAGLAGPPAGTLLHDLDHEGVVRLYGYNSARDFLTALATADPASVSSTVAAGTAVVDFAVFREVARRFRCFLLVGGVASLLSIALLAAAAFSAAEAPRRVPALTSPIRVELRFAPGGRDALKTQFGCSPADPAKAWAVGDSIDAPQLVIDGCVADRLKWNDAWGEAVPVGPSGP